MADLSVPTTRRMFARLRTMNNCSRANVTMTYNRSDPYAVTVDISVNDSDARWVFARELLAHGVRAPVDRPAGEYWVRVWRDTFGNGPAVFLELGYPDKLIVQLDRRDVITFLRETYAVVPLGAEYVHADAELTLLLAS